MFYSFKRWAGGIVLNLYNHESRSNRYIKRNKHKYRLFTTITNYSNDYDIQ